jgi:hypothetical protein
LNLNCLLLSDAERGDMALFRGRRLQRAL